MKIIVTVLFTSLVLGETANFYVYYNQITGALC